MALQFFEATPEDIAPLSEEEQKAKRPVGLLETAVQLIKRTDVSRCVLLLNLHSTSISGSCHTASRSHITASPARAVSGPGQLPEGQ